jgi:hypothetical protein
VIGARVETTLGTRRLSAVELGGVNVNGVPTDAQADLHRAVAAHVAFERHVLKPGFHLIGARVETTWVPGAFQLWVRGGVNAHRPTALPPLRMLAPPPMPPLEEELFPDKDFLPPLL